MAPSDDSEKILCYYTELACLPGSYQLWKRRNYEVSDRVRTATLQLQIGSQYDILCLLS